MALNGDDLSCSTRHVLSDVLLEARAHAGLQVPILTAQGCLLNCASLALNDFGGLSMS